MRTLQVRMALGFEVLSQPTNYCNLHPISCIVRTAGEGTSPQRDGRDSEKISIAFLIQSVDLLR